MRYHMNEFFLRARMVGRARSPLERARRLKSARICMGLTSPNALCYAYTSHNTGPNGRMSSKPQRIEIVLETVIDSIALAEEMSVRLAAAAGFNEDDQYRIGLALHESVMNAYQYGNEQKREKKIHVVFELSHEKMAIRVTDQGTGFRVEEVPDPRMDENMLGETGRGVLLMRAFMDEFDVLVRQGGGAEVIMAKRYKTQ